MAQQPLTGQIEHIVVVMFENRSFDNMLGGLYPWSTTYEGLKGTETNPLNPCSSGSSVVQVWQGSSGIDAMIMPFPDPNESFNDMTQQLFGCDWASATGATASGAPTMDGFVWNYLTAPVVGGVNPTAADILQYYAAGPDGNIPVTSALAAAYTVSDRWFASGPVQTFPNRLFAHCATPGVSPAGAAYLNDTDYKSVIEDGGVLYPSVFSVLDKALPKQTNWKVYYSDPSLVLGVPAGILSVLLVNYVFEAYVNQIPYSQVAPYTQFATDVAADKLPPYSFIEPRYFSDAHGRAQSYHPGNAAPPMQSGDPEAISVCDGEVFLADIYNTLISNQAVFDKTLLVVIYDEHGGVYDHVPPPSAPSPWPAGTITGFDYDRYGARVPCLLINPYVNRSDGVAFRPQVASNPNPFDHATIIQTVIQQFLPSSQWTFLTNRDANAPVLSGLINPANTPIPNVSLPALNCPAPPVYPSSSGQILSPRQELFQAIAKARVHRDEPTRK